MKDIKNKIIDYIKETRAEVRKVTWPGRQYVTAATVIVLLIVIVLAVAVMLLDWGLAKMFLFLSRSA
ncbi:MAG TPA: preprotein translocase subunit SecE [Candidatus Omnitrophota bacterium]|nr:preprotein translocase subunit SecE [Candidatus Omnitrophota bacterium]